MNDIKWIKLSTDLFDNRKIRMIEQMPEGDAMVVIWLHLLIIAGRANEGGAVYFTEDIAYTDQLLAMQIGRPLATVQMALQTFERFHMIEIVDDVIQISNWERYQSADRLEQIRENGRKRVAAFRERKKLEMKGGGCNVTCNADVTRGNALEIEKEIEIEIEKKESEEKKRKRFSPPTLDEVKTYVHERGDRISAEAFVAYYESNGWKVGKNTMKDWKAAVRSWEAREKKQPEQRQQPKGTFFAFPQREIDEEDEEALELRLRKKALGKD